MNVLTNRHNIYNLFSSSDKNRFKKGSVLALFLLSLFQSSAVLAEPELENVNAGLPPLEGITSTSPKLSEPQERGVGYGLYKDKDYVIGVGDSIQVSVWRNPDLSVVVTVRPDGKISAPLVGDMTAASRTPMQLADDITRSLSTYIRNPQVSIIMAGLSSHEYLTRVRVTGAVKSPTSRPHSKGMTLLDLILDAGGVNDFAAPNRTVLYRTNSEGKTKAIKVKLNDLLKKGKLKDNIVLEPGDVITVPESFF